MKINKNCFCAFVFLILQKKITVGFWPLVSPFCMPVPPGADVNRPPVEQVVLMLSPKERVESLLLLVKESNKTKAQQTHHLWEEWYEGPRKECLSSGWSFHCFLLQWSPPWTPGTHNIFMCRRTWGLLGSPKVTSPLHMISAPAPWSPSNDTPRCASCVPSIPSHHGRAWLHRIYTFYKPSNQLKSIILPFGPQHNLYHCTHAMFFELDKINHIITCSHISN
jgi:hypothetical protein